MQIRVGPVIHVRPGASDIFSGRFENSRLQTGREWIVVLAEKVRQLWAEDTSLLQ